MKKRALLLATMLSLVLQSYVLADRQLSREEVLQIFQILTGRPKERWISAGTIRARHLEYRSSDGYVTDSTVLVKNDGNKFYWEINIDSRSQGTTKSEGTYEDVELNWNRRRIFIWDGERYVKYFKSSNQATIIEEPGNMPVTVNGPLTAGVVPWGYGMHTFANLSSAESYGTIDDHGQVHLTIGIQAAGFAPKIDVVLEPAKEHATLSYSMSYNGIRTVTITYENYQLVSNTWIPAIINIDRYDRSNPAELLSHDEWNLTYIDLAAPPPDAFRAVYDIDTLIEYYSPVSDRPLKYNYSTSADIESLLQNRLEIASGNTQTSNCATAVMKYVTKQLSRKVSDSNLAELVSGPTESTSLYTIKEFAQNLGFHCLAVQTDIQTLSGLKGCQVILHLPRTNHYVVLESVEDKQVRIIDLDSNKFYFSSPIDQFSLDWEAGTALLVSKEPLLLTGTFTVIGDSKLQQIVGGFPNYSCTKWLQEGREVGCSAPVLGLCGGAYYSVFGRLGCEENPSGGTCIGTDLPDYDYIHCIDDIWDPTDCAITGSWYRRYMRACD